MRRLLLFAHAIVNCIWSDVFSHPWKDLQSCSLKACSGFSSLQSAWLCLAFIDVLVAKTWKHQVTTCHPRTVVALSGSSQENVCQRGKVEWRTSRRSCAMLCNIIELETDGSNDSKTRSLFMWEGLMWTFFLFCEGARLFWGLWLERHEGWDKMQVFTSLCFPKNSWTL